MNATSGDDELCIHGVAFKDSCAICKHIASRTLTNRDQDEELAGLITYILGFVNDTRYKLIDLRAQVRRLQQNVEDHRAAEEALAETCNDWRDRALKAEADYQQLRDEQ